MAKGYPMISGRIGSVVVCHIKASNTIIYRSRPRKYRQTAATIAAQSSFGLAVKAGKLLRRRLEEILPFPKNKLMQSKFSGAISSWLKTTNVDDIPLNTAIATLKTFSFNKDCSLERRLKLAITTKTDAEGKLVIVLPAFVPADQLSVPAQTSRVECRVAVASCNLSESTDAGYFNINFDIPWFSPNLPEVEIPTGVATEKGNLVVCGARLIYYKQDNSSETSINNPDFMPAGLFSAMYY